MNDEPKYPKPKILLVDLEREAESVLTDVGYNVVSGSFGVPYEVPRDYGFSSVIPNCSLPNFGELEVVVVNLVRGDTLESPRGG